MPRIEAPTVAEHHALRRAAILDAAVAVLAAEGPAALTPSAVAATAGLARSSVYQYFASTAELVAAGVEETFRRAIAGIESALATADTPQEKIAAYVGGALDAAASGHEPMSVYAAADLPEACRAAVADLHRQATIPLVEPLEQLDVADPWAMAELIGGVVSAGASQVSRGEPLDAVRVRVQAFVLRALAL
ncbi:MAG: TetR/AcrR family transcriptional regulator [Propionibacterium sp.]|nr:TetR/AcrR family transcriptional regulator [Propionibacterium sp.]